MIYNWPVNKKKFEETWYLNQVCTPSENYKLNINIKFKDLNNTTYNKFKISGTPIVVIVDDEMWSYLGELSYDDKLVYISNWADEAYRTIKFLEPPTGDLLTWLQQNGVKQ